MGAPPSNDTTRLSVIFFPIAASKGLEKRIAETCSRHNLPWVRIDAVGSRGATSRRQTRRPSDRLKFVSTPLENRVALALIFLLSRDGPLGRPKVLAGEQCGPDCDKQRGLHDQNSYLEKRADSESLPSRWSAVSQRIVAREQVRPKIDPMRTAWGTWSGSVSITRCRARRPR